MDFETHKDLIAYPCIFCRSEADAVSNLVRLITQQHASYNHGPQRWAAALTEWLTGPYDLQALSIFGARFTAEQWRTILRQVVAELEQTPQDKPSA